MLVGGLLGVFVLQNRDKNDWLVLTDFMAGGSPLCLAGRWLVDWIWQWGLQNVVDCWLVGGLVLFDFKIETKMTELTCLDWLHGWRLPSLLSWSVVAWLVLAKRLTECLADCWLVGGLLFFIAKWRLKTDWLVLISWLTAWRAAPLFA